MQISRTIDQRLYPGEAISEAGHEYRNFCTLSISPLGSDQVEVVITVKPKHKARGREVVLEFLNYLLDRAAEIHLEAE